MQEQVIIFICVHCGVSYMATEPQVSFPVKKDVNKIKTRMNGHVYLCALWHLIHYI